MKGDALRKYGFLVLGIVVVAVALFLFMGGGDHSYERVQVSGDDSGDTSRVLEGFDVDKIVSGGPPKDGIPSIDEPQFVSVKEADNWIADNELVLGLNYNGVLKVYPLQILVWHEIVNDYANDKPVLITYCPLCGTGIAYEPILDGEVVEFGTSGKLYNSNLIMYDRKTDSYWTQIDGVAVVGELVGEHLTAIPLDTVSWREWKAAHPDSLVLSQDTGHSREYGVDPYGSYYEEDFLFFPVDARDDRIHAKEVMFGIEIDGRYKAYLEEDVLSLGSFEDEFSGVTLLIERKDSGEVVIVDVETGERIVHERGFWFSWYAFHPETEVFGR